MGLFLTLVNIPDQDWCAPLTDRPQVIGRSSTAEIRLFHRFQRVSRRHASVWMALQQAWIKDLESKCGTWLNGIPLVPHHDYPLVAGDTIRLGDATLECVASETLTAVMPQEMNHPAPQDDLETVGPAKMASAADFDLDKLSYAEAQVLHWLRRGFVTHEEIGRKLHRSPHTVRTQLANIFQKLGVGSREELLRGIGQFAESQGEGFSQP